MTEPVSWHDALCRAGCTEAAATSGSDAIEAWLRRHPDDRDSLRHQAAHAAGELARCFTTRIRFGTGGVRGRVGPGPGGLNLDTARKLARAHAALLASEKAGGSVVLGWDMRAFHDRTQRCGVVPPSVDAVRSIDLARAAADAYVAAGLDVWWPNGKTVSTPMASYLVPALGAAGAMVVTASHNPPDDNGLKLYGPDGVQLAPPVDEAVLSHLGAPALAATPGRIREVPTEVEQAFLTSVSAVGRGSIGVVYSPLHGTGIDVVAPALEGAGFDVAVVAEQAVLDPAFGTLPGGSANPESPEVYALAIAEADRLGLDVVFTTDPDADRIGMCVRGAGGWRMLNGHEIAVVALAHRLASHRGPGVVLTTEVTTRWLGRMARAAGVDVVEHLPVGFKFLGRWRRDAVADLPLILAAEESHGLLVHEHAGDKDAAGAAVVLAAAADAAAKRGETVLDVLDRVQREHGPVAHVQRSARLEGLGARERLLARLDALASDPPAELAGVRLSDAHDRGVPPAEGWRSDSEATSWRALVWQLGEEGRVIMRPSGTEPKVKVYAECWRGDRTRAVALAEDALAAVTA